jgi:hypothetical protein
MKYLPLHIQSRIWNSENWGILADVRLYTQTQGGCPYKGDVAGRGKREEGRGQTIGKIILVEFLSSTCLSLKYAPSNKLSW